MFSGIIETAAPVRGAHWRDQVIQIDIEKPLDFNDLNVGHSIAVNGVCLTLEAFTETEMTFAVAAETLQVTGWDVPRLLGRNVNLERSLRMGERIHGHLVTGHVDGRGIVVQKEQLGESLWMMIAPDEKVRPFLWSKGSVAVNGVSLTLNEVSPSGFTICLIPETLKRTNLGDLLIGDFVNLEADQVARGIVHSLPRRGEVEL